MHPNTRSARPDACASGGAKAADLVAAHREHPSDSESLPGQITSSYQQAGARSLHENHHSRALMESWLNSGKKDAPTATPPGPDSKKRNKTQTSCRDENYKETGNHDTDGNGGQNGLGGDGASGAKKRQRESKPNETSTTNGSCRQSSRSKTSQRPVSYIGTDGSDTACWSCCLPNARWICSRDGCEIRYCCQCARCPCKGTVPCDPALDSTQFHCPLCRAIWRLPPVPRFGWTDVCFTCPSKSKETVNCVICHNNVCLECASAVSARTDYTCLICSCATEGIVDGRRAYMESLKGGLHSTFRQIIGANYKPAQLQTVKLTATGMHAHYKQAIELSHRMTSMCRAGLNGIVDGNALKALAHINESYVLGTGTSPCAVLDLVYLLHGDDMTWRSVELAARAHATAERAKVSVDHTGFKRARVAQSINGSSSGSQEVFRLGFYSHDLALGSATNDLVHQLLISMDGWKGMFEVFIYSFACERKGKGWAKPGYDTTCWRSKALIEYFISKRRCRLFSKKEKPELIANTIIRDRLDLFVHMPGFNYGGLYEVLFLIRIKSPGTCVVQWLGCAGMMHAPEAVHFTISSESVLDRKLLSTPREAAALFDNAYPLPQIPEELLVDNLTLDGSKFFKLPANRRRLCFLGTSTRLRRERVILALRILVACGHGPTSPVLFIMLFGCNHYDGVKMFISVLCWAEEWRIANCPAFDPVDRIRPYRFYADQREWYAFILQMHAGLDCYPCGLHTTALEFIALCKLFVALRGYLAHWPSLVAAAKLEQGGYGKALVADCEDECVVLVVRLLMNKDFADALEQKLRCDRAAGIGMYDTIRSLENWEVGVPLMVSKVQAGGVLEDVDIASKLPARPPGGMSGPDICMFESPKAQRERVLEAMAKTGRKWAGHSEGACKVLEKAQEDGLELLGLAGTGAYNFAVRAVYNGVDNIHVSKGQRVILKVQHAGRMNDPIHLCRIGQEQMDSNLRSASFMESAHRFLVGTKHADFVVKAVPIFKNSRGQRCVSGYLVIGTLEACHCAISFHCCEDMGPDLKQTGLLDTWAKEVRQSGSIPDDLRHFHDYMYSGLEALHSSGLFVMDLSPGNIAVTSTGAPCVIDVGSGVMTGNGVLQVERQAKTLTLAPDQNGFVILHSDELSTIPSCTAIGHGTRGCRSEPLAECLRLSKSLPPPDLCCAIDLWSAAMLHMQAYALIDESNRELRVGALENALNSANPGSVYHLLCSWLGPGAEPPNILCRLAKQFPRLHFRNFRFHNDRLLSLFVCRTLPR